MCLDDGGAREPLCPRPQTLGVMHDGGFATHLLLKHSRYAVPTRGVPAAFAATCACSGLTSYTALKRAGPIPDDMSIVFIGAGGVGLAAITIFRAMNPTHPGPTVCDVDPRKLEAATRLGASRTFLAADMCVYFFAHLC